MNFIKLALPIVISTILLSPSANANPSVKFQALQQSYQATIRPMLSTYCNDCHSTESKEGELDLERFTTLDTIRKDASVWQRVRTMLSNGEMPPADSTPLPPEQRKQLQLWVNTYLQAEAIANAGDPGPVVLQRLNNAEYTYTIRDLTGLNALSPTREFPVDGAAGEGFTNTGISLSMSPSMLQKYLASAKEIANHLVLLPDGIAFSPHQSRRDRTDHLIGQIQSFYRKYTDHEGGSQVDLHGIKFATNQGGRLPLSRYLAATLEERNALQHGSASIEQIASARNLSDKYLGLLWDTLQGEIDQQEDPLMYNLQQQWKATQKPERLLARITAWQEALWSFNTIGHFGREDGPSSWMEPRSPITFKQIVNWQLPDVGDRDHVTFYLITGHAGDGVAEDVVVWKKPRLLAEGQPTLALSDLQGVEQRIHDTRQAMLGKIDLYLAAVTQIILGKRTANTAAQAFRIDPLLLNNWLDYLRAGGGPVTVEGHFTEQTLSVANYDFINGWGSNATPSIVANSSDQAVKIPGDAKPHAMLAHPSPTNFAAVGWQSPIDAHLTIEAIANDAHNAAGNGIEVAVQHRTSASSGLLWKAILPEGGSGKMLPHTLRVRKGELISFLVGPHEGNHGYDLTQFNLIIREPTGQKRVWNLAADVSANLTESNPRNDNYGHEAVWHFFQGPVKEQFSAIPTTAVIPDKSFLSQWQNALTPTQQTQLASKIRKLALDAPPLEADSPNARLYRQLQSFPIPIDHPKVASPVSTDARFGHPPAHESLSPSDLVVKAPSITEFRVPAQLAKNRTFVTEIALDPTHGREGSVQVKVTEEKPASIDSWPDVPLILSEGSDTHKRIQRGYEHFRELFPAALCYSRIVPVDEVVTLALFHREDDPLKRLMLKDQEAATLDRLWKQLLYVSQEPFQLAIAFEQISEFATQDRPDLVKALRPTAQKVRRRVEVFEQQLATTEPVHLESVIELADQAWRRQLSPKERQQLRDFYRKLRNEKINHPEAIQLTLVRILTSPAFLYHQESPSVGREPTPVSNEQLANRLSYFLWSSLPDPPLRQSAAANRLDEQAVLVAETHRMLQDPRTRRLAIHFACQWLHVRDFDLNVEKNETLYPQFSKLRPAMYEETVRFFEDMFRNNGSILDLLDADHTFLNAKLAQHYGIPNVEGDEWQRVDGLRQFDRGGILGMGTFLASQSGISRTSPILRGNWIFETLLGERLPRPPPNVPQIPEQLPPDLTARELIERHSSDAACAKCHEKIDPYGFALEQFDTIGRLRPQSVNTTTKLADETPVEGFDALRRYLLNQRRDAIVGQFCRKLLGYALGRSVRLSDEPLLAIIKRQLETHDYRFSTAVELIVTSPQFRNIRGREFVAP
ncbi:MAG: DUF1592 domain-containing protein [Planctomycetaceae bacterium]|nr:DUF1592 domain-containing protein [Planctomycetaceae bacterium]